MGFETSPFGNGVTIGSGGNVNGDVNNHYGKRASGDTVGITKTYGTHEELTIDFTGAQLSTESFALLAPVIPAGALIKSVMMKITEAFSVSGSTPVLEIGTAGSESTNGFTTSEAQLEAIGTVDLTSALSGTWDEVVLAAETTVGVDFGGSAVFLATVGRGKWVIEYQVVNA